MSKITFKKAPEFVTMPLEVLANQNLSSGAKNLFYNFYLFKKAPHGCYATNEYLSHVAFMDERNVPRCIKILEEWRYITVVKSQGRSHRRIFITDFSRIYRKVVEEIYSQNRSIEKYSSVKNKKMFKEALNSYKYEIPLFKDTLEK